jgi:hypothetical protein
MQSIGSHNLVHFGILDKNLCLSVASTVLQRFVSMRVKDLLTMCTGSIFSPVLHRTILEKEKLLLEQFLTFLREDSERFVVNGENILDMESTVHMRHAPTLTVGLSTSSQMGYSQCLQFDKISDGWETQSRLTSLGSSSIDSNSLGRSKIVSHLHHPHTKITSSLRPPTNNTEDPGLISNFQQFGFNGNPINGSSSTNNNNNNTYYTCNNVDSSRISNPSVRSTFPLNYASLDSGILSRMNGGRLY